MDTSENQQGLGYVYCLTNEGMPGIVKIGFTDNLQQRLQEANQTQTFKSPYSFKCIYAIKVKNAYSVEKLFHISLDKFQIKREETGKLSEFFKISSDAIYSLFYIYLKSNNFYRCCWVYNNYVKIERPTVRCVYTNKCIVCNCNSKNHEIEHSMIELIQKQKEYIEIINSTPNKIFEIKMKENLHFVHKLTEIIEQKCKISKEVKLDE
jgi:hypothetical protein